MIKINRIEAGSSIMRSFAVLRRKSTQIMRTWTTKYSDSQRELIGILARRSVSGMSIKEIAQVLQVSSSAATQQVDSLDKLGYIERHPSKKDGRSVRIYLSEKANKHLAANIPEFIDEIEEAFLKTLTDRELARLDTLLKKVADQLDPPN